MAESTAISWTDHTFNPWWGCERVSPGCQNCYAEAFAKRTGHKVWGKQAERRFFGDKHWNEPFRWDRQAEAEGRRHRVFCASMADVFEDRPELSEHRERLFDTIDGTPWLDWQLLTKRPENVVRLAEGWIAGADYPHDWRPNVWIGTTAEDQQRADERIPHLLRIPAAVRFLSCEPLLSEVRLARWLFDGTDRVADGISWVIVGGESGPRHRPFDLAWARILQRECDAAGVPFFFKQVGGRTPTAGGDELDGQTWKQFPTAQEVAL